MSLRSTWKGMLKVGMASIPVRKYASGETSSTVAFNQLHRACGCRLRQQMVCPNCNNVAVSQTDIVKGFNRGSEKEPSYVVLEKQEIDAVAVESSHAIIVERIVPASQLHPLYIERADYIAPDGKAALYDFAVLREAMRGLVGIARLCERGRENVIALHADGPGIVAYTLRTNEEVRPMDKIDELSMPVNVRNEDVELAKSFLIAPAVRESFADMTQRDRYAEKLRELIDAKASGATLPAPVVPVTQSPSSMMDMLRTQLAKAGVTVVNSPQDLVVPVMPTTSLVESKQKAGDSSFAIAKSKAKAKPVKAARR